MNNRAEQSRATGGDIVKYAVALLLVAGGVFAFSWFDGQWPTPARVAVVVGGLVLGAAVFLFSGKGRQTVGFLSESRFELRKVVWPTRQEAMRLTWVVIAVVVAISLILAAFDAVIRYVLKLFLGH